MLTAPKVFWVAVGLYALTIFLPAAIPDGIHASFPGTVVVTTLVACAAFLLGMGLGALMFPFSRSPQAADSGDMDRGLIVVVALAAAVALYVVVAGPPAPFFQAFTLTDPEAIMFAREDALKLNADLVFVRLYSWGRDLFGPVAFVLSIQALRSGAKGRMRVVAILGLLVSAYLGLWSGQKATVVNYLLATFIFASANARSMTTTALKIAPLLLVVVAALFYLTLPQLVGNPQALSILTTSIANRLLFAPLKVAASYVDAMDRLAVISPTDALPYVSFLWTPGTLSLENHIGLLYFNSDMESSVHANGAAFAYAYVVGGVIACFVAGFLVMLGLQTAVRIVRATRSAFIEGAFAAIVSYVLLDLLNGNFMSYLLRIVVISILAWGAHALYPKRVRALATPSTSS